MNLTPEEKAVGKENFQGAIASPLLKHQGPGGPSTGGSVNRRDFLLGSAALGLASGAGLGAYYFGYGRSVGNPVRVGFIGTGDEGGVLIGAHNPEYLNIVAIADIRPYNVHRAFHGDTTNATAYINRPGLMNKYRWTSEDQARRHVKVYGNNYSELIKDPDVEAVVIALPLHLHARAAIEAMLAGKHVLTEKLMGHSVAECKEMARVAHGKGGNKPRLLATGHQRHYSILYDNAVQLIKGGVLGDLHFIRAQWHRGNVPGKDTWQPALPDEIEKKIAELTKKRDAAKKAKDPATVDELTETIGRLELQALDKTVDAEKYGYQYKKGYEGVDKKPRSITPIEELIRWRLFARTGGGLMAELGSHQLDASGIFISALQDGAKKALPLTVQATGGRYIFPHDRDCEDHVFCTYEFPKPGYESDEKTPDKKVGVTYSSINGNGYGGYGETVLGTQGTLILEREQEVMLFGGADTKTKVAVSKKGDDTVLDTQQSPGASAEVGEKALTTGPISRGYTEEMEHWAWCIREFDPKSKLDENPQPKCHPEIALGDAVIALTTNIAIKTGEKIPFRKAWFEYEKDDTPEGPQPDVNRYAGLG